MLAAAPLRVRRCLTLVAGIVRRVLGSFGRSLIRHRLSGHPHSTEYNVSKILRGLAAGYGAKRLGGGCFTTVLVFIILWWLLGHFRLFR